MIDLIIYAFVIGLRSPCYRFCHTAAVDQDQHQCHCRLPCFFVDDIRSRIADDELMSRRYIRKSVGWYEKRSCKCDKCDSFSLQ